MAFPPETLGVRGFGRGVGQDGEELPSCVVGRWGRGFCSCDVESETLCVVQLLEGKEGVLFCFYEV